MKLLHGYSWIKQRMIGERLGVLDERLASRDRRVIWGKARDGTEDPKVDSMNSRG